jgi:hypothetical protein
VPEFASRWWSRDDFCPSKNQNPKECIALYETPEVLSWKNTVHTVTHLIIETSFKIKLRNHQMPETSHFDV